MLSYQHAYHAGNRADIQKHSLLAAVLEAMARHDVPINYIETHAGRGVYDLDSAEAAKTGEAEEGWLALKPSALKKLPEGYVGAVKALNNGELLPLYPGSPAVAAHILRPQDSMTLMELHPQEYDALTKAMGHDKRIQIQKRDGIEGVLSLKPKPNTLVLVDPSYEIKTEYQTIPDFVGMLADKWPGVHILVWIPMLPAERHQLMLERLRGDFPQLEIFKEQWGQEKIGIYGSIMAGINLPDDL